MSTGVAAPTPTPEYLAESTVTTVKAVMWVAAIVPLVFVCLRSYVRIHLRHAFGLDDLIAIIATLLLIAYSAIATAASKKGLGRHIEFVAQEPQNVIDVALLCDISEVFAIMACTLGKTSFAVTLMRLVIQRWIIIVLWFIIITMNLVNVLAAIFVFAQCKDPRHLWNPAITSKCWDVDVFTNFSLFVGAYSGAQDFVLALLPWALIWNLQMQKKEKFGIAFAMSLGIFAGATAIVKTTYLVALSKKTDFTYALAPLLWWAALEDGLTIVAASIATLRPLLRQIFPGSQNEKTDYPLKSMTKNSHTANRFWKVDSTHSVVGHDGESDKCIMEQHNGESSRHTDVG